MHLPVSQELHHMQGEVNVNDDHSPSTCAHGVPKCLLISEIMEKILGHAHDFEEGLPTLAAMAASCKTFCDPAMDVLWREVADVVPIMQCLPADAWQVTATPRAPLLNDRYLDKMLSLTAGRTLSAKEWERADINALRVKRISFQVIYRLSPRIRWTVSPTVFEAIRRHIGSSDQSCLFPNAKKLEVSYAPQENNGVVWTDVPYLVGGRLTELSIYRSIFQPSAVAVNDTLGTIFSRCRSLTRVLLEFEDAQLWSLESVMVFVGLLERSPQIQFLRTNVDLNYQPEAGRMVPPEPLLLPCIETLIFGQPSFSGASKFLTMVASRNLDTAMMFCSDTEALEREVRLYFQCLARFSSLTYIVVTTSLSPPHDDLSVYRDIPPTLIVTSQTISPLFCLRGLTHIELQITRIVDLTDDFISRLAQAWPSLRRLDFTSAIPHVIQPLLTFKGLLALSEYSTNLRNLTINFHPTLPSKMAVQRAKELRRRHGVEAHPLREISCYFTSPPSDDDPEALADFITDLFPNLEGFAPVSQMGPPSETLDVAEAGWERLQQAVYMRIPKDTSDSD
ncbi:hypothetical protein EIP91_007022 [Steccherinum ochraceum]|uniref:F-box domain-containing protein n=1 Tax=Steccherinum ochraceum TaxID=92696 RepID=A0A4R0RLK4_9APHY|nr:hypothetical protein EIP91_007022 [Steccherinum ochraceum]